jgi:hypothetical protein
MPRGAPLLAVDTLPLVGELAILLSRLPGGAVGRTTMSAAMLPTITAPTLIIWGRCDYVLQPACAGREAPSPRVVVPVQIV